MYDLYKEYSKETKPVSFSTYKAIFYKNFSLQKGHFHSIKNKDNDVHLKKAEALQNTIKKDPCFTKT